MKIISFKNISDVNIPPEMFYEWAEEMLIQKNTSILPPKISLTQAPSSFFNIMPCALPNLDIMGVKVVMRYPKQEPSLTSQIILYRQSTGEPLALMDGTYITALRTGAVAAHSINIFAKKNFDTIGFIGLGNTARATLNVFANTFRDKTYNLKLLRYKNQAESFVNRFRENENLSFSIHENKEDVIANSDVVVSCITYADALLADDSCYMPGCTVIPVHTRGFQNCDLFFDRVFADDRGHVEHFQNFDKFKCFAETCDVATRKSPGRVSDEERILVYNIGIAIHDMFFAQKIYTLLSGLPDSVGLTDECLEKFWV